MQRLVALVGRPNVGKSTLFNRLSIRKKAIVHDRPGVTRDRKYADAQIGPLELQVIDTPGFEEVEEGKLEQRMADQTINAVMEADLVCLVVDGQSGVLPEDKSFANLLRKYDKPMILVVNKCEGTFNFSQEYYKLGISEPVALSAEHGIGLMELYDAITMIFAHTETFHHVSDPVKSDNIQIVVSGRPNAGKSTFINAIINDARLLTGPEAGITRESIAIDWQYKGHHMQLIDTAGLRKKSAVHQSLEKLSTTDTINSIKFANIVVLMIDVLTPLEQQDLNIANYVEEQGRSLVIAVNKWDLILDKKTFKKEFHYKVSTYLPQLKGIPVVFISALDAQHVAQVLDECIKIYAIWNKKIPTSKLNDWLGFTTEAHQLPLQKGGRRIRIKYITQTKTRPPTFKLFSNNPEKITDSYKRYLINNLRESFDMPGTPIRFIMCKTKNPYVI